MPLWAGMQTKTKWSPGPGAKVLGVAPTADDSWVVSAAGPGFGICPDCGRRTRNRHGWSNRSLQDLPVQGKAVTVTVHAMHKEGLSCSEKAKFSRKRSRLPPAPKNICCARCHCRMARRGDGGVRDFGCCPVKHGRTCKADPFQSPWTAAAC